MWKHSLFVIFLLFNVTLWIAEVQFEFIDFTVYSKILSRFHNQDVAPPPSNQTQVQTTTVAGVTFKKRACPWGPIVTSEAGDGRMANRIWEYLGTWGLAKFLGRQAFVPKVTFDWLLPIFPDLDLPIFEEIKHCNLSLQRIREVDSLDTLKERVQGQHLIFEKWYVLPRVVLPYLDEARKMFRFADDLVLKVNQTIRAVGGEGRVLVAVHVRRTDYIGFLVNRYHLTIANKFYYLDAMDWFRKNIGGKLLFLIVSDDPPWCELNLLGQEDVVMASKDAHHDLALLTLADHNIIDYGTYGAFAGLMTKGHTVTLFSIDFDQVMAKYKNWHVMDERKYMTKLQ